MNAPSDVERAFQARVKVVPRIGWSGFLTALDADLKVRSTRTTQDTPILEPL